MQAKIHWLGHSGFKITGEKTIYFDPYQIADTQKADIILISHDHYDHLSLRDIGLIRSKETTIVVPEEINSTLLGDVRSLYPGDVIEISGVQIQAVPAYNIGKPFHPKSKYYLGYIVTMGGESFYHSGDTDYIPEMKAIRADVVMLPVSGTYTMTAEEAARAVADIQPKIAIPMHWGSVAGSRADAERFKQLCQCEVWIPEKT